MAKSGMRLFVVCALLAALVPFASAQEPYKVPPQEVVDIVDAPPTPSVSMSPDGGTMALIERESMPSIAYLSEPILRIAGMRITPAYNSRQVLSFATGLSLKDIKTGVLRRVALPDGFKFASGMGGAAWSPDGARIALTRYVEGGVELWVVDVKAGTAKALTTPVLNAVLGGPEWLPDGKRILATLVPEGRGPAPVAPRVPVGPEVQVSGGKEAKVATYQDLLKNAFDEVLFDYYATSQPALIDASTGEIRKIGRPGVYDGASVAPSMEYIFVSRIKRPYSYALPADGFAHSMEVWDMDGGLIKVLADLPTEENVPINGVPTGPRAINWMTHKPATLVWTEALDGGDPKKDAPFRDRYLALDAPFAAEPQELFKLKERAAGLQYFATPGKALAAQSEWKRSWRTTFLVDLTNPAAAPVKVWDLSTQDSYKNPGRPVTTTPQDRRAGHPPGQGLDLPERRRIVPRGRPSLPRPDERPDAQGRAALAVPGPRLRDLRRFRRRLADEIHHQLRIEDRAAELLPLRPQDEEARGPDRFQGPGPPADRDPEGTDQVQAYRRSRAQRHALPAAGIQGRDPPARRRLGLSPGVRFGGDGRPGPRLGQPLHLLPRHVASCSS